MPDQSFSHSYNAADFNLSENDEDWEIRKGPVSGSSSTDYEVRSQYDTEYFDGLSEFQRELVRDQASNFGYDAQCMPGYCPIYIVALLNGSPVVIDSRTELLAFLGEIDTESELSLWLSANNYSGLNYEFDNGVYHVLAGWDSLCGTRGTDLIRVLPTGEIDFIRQQSEENYSGCV